MITKPFGRVLFAVAAWLPLSVLAAGGTTPCLQMSKGWVRQPPHTAMPMAAGFGTLVNRCEVAQVVEGAASSLFAEVSLHETINDDGVSRMRPIERLVVPARGEVTLAPGGLHLMLMRGGKPLVDGQAVTLELRLHDGTAVPVEMRAARSAP